MVLSVLVISHNQKAQVRRCLDSIISQEIPFEYEIVVSDDASTDGTWELEQEYAVRYPFIKCWRCNSDDCHPTITSERSGHNRSNAYTHSSGKYFVHIDADDWYRPGSQCLEQQVSLLEKHPECSMCMQNGWYWDENTELTEGGPLYDLHRFKTGQIISVNQYFKDNLFVNNGVMMMRRNPQVNPAVKYHKWYVDSVITTHHLQFGSIVCLDVCDWLYTQTPNSIVISTSSNDRRILWGLDCNVFLSILVPKLRCSVYANPVSLSQLMDVVRYIFSGIQLSDSLIQFCHQFNDVFIYRIITKDSLGGIDKVRLLLIREHIKRMSVMPYEKRMAYSRILHRLCVG